MTLLLKRSFSYLSLILAACALIACAQNSVQSAAVKSTPLALFKTTQTQRCIEADGLPDHPTGTFPNRGNPNAIAPQDVKLCMPLSPKKADAPTSSGGTQLFIVPGLRYSPRQNWSLFGSIAFPIHEDLGGIQNDTDYRLTTGAAFNF